MRSLRVTLSRLSGLFRKRNDDQEFTDELAANLQMHIDDNIRAGMTLDEARRQARIALGGVVQTHEHYRDRRGVPFIDHLLQDLRYGLRTLGKNPGFTAAAVLTLALGIGANTAIFGVWNSVLHASLPVVSKPEQLVMLSDPDRAGSMWSGRWESRTDGPRAWFTWGEFEQLRDDAEGFSTLMATQNSLSTWAIHIDGAPAEEASGRLVSGSFFKVLGIKPIVGRVFTAADDRAPTPEAVISYTYWQRRFGGQTDVLGKTFTLRDTALTIIGVAPAGFIGETSGQQPDLWMPLTMQSSALPGEDRLHDTPPTKVMWLQVFGRLKPGVTPTQAEAEANGIFQTGLASFYGAVASSDRQRAYLDQRLQLRSGARGASEARPAFSTSLTALLVAVGVLLLIACANLANLLLARGAARQPEIALRVALGATRGRLLRQFLTESLTLAIMGGVAALAAAYLLHEALVPLLATSDASFRMSFVMDGSVVAFLVAATLGAALFFGLLPAWQVVRGDAGAKLREQHRGTKDSRRQTRAGRWLVSLQLALSLPLLVGAGLLVRTVYNLQHADLGFPAGRLLLVRVDLGDMARSGTDRSTRARELLREVQGIPGVRAASFSQLGVFSGGESSTGIEVEGYAPRGDRDRSSATDDVGPKYFSTLGIPLVLGRDIQESDNAGAATVCVINQAFAKRFFDGRNPVAMRVTSRDGDQRTTCQVVGVAANAHTRNVRGDVEPRFFMAAQQPPYAAPSPTLLIRTSVDTAAVMASVRKAIQRVEPTLPILSARSIEEQMAPLTAQDRTSAQLAMVFGGVALALAAIGLYGVLAYGVARRTGEIAVRLALGAQPARVVAMILGETLGTIAAGLLLGEGLAYAASHLINSRLYGVAPLDPLTLVLATGLLLMVALSAAVVPALSASRLDPMAALRQE